ncbi:MAG: transglutaminase domain-containing protein [Clostridia bacterium]|nr:hypothetical protein [[Bacteroides] pectinophilus]MDD5872996.1 transglutaminase domain-containing protein [Clostridia bacterium]
MNRHFGRYLVQCSLILCVALLCQALTACGNIYDIDTLLSGSKAASSDSRYTLYTSQDDITSLLLQTMYENKDSCTFNVPDRSYVDADAWLNSLAGLNKIHCEYITYSGFCQVTAQIEYWDNYPIIYAYRSNDTSALNERQAAMYDRYCDILSSTVSSSNPDVINELTVHDYIVNNVRYVLDRNSDSPAYDALFNGSASCSGYTEVFQTLMDMAGISCIPVTGQAGGDNHIWNMVCLDGQWYHVDTTWDDPVGGDGTVRHNYFNITDDDILLDHTIESEHPAATSTDLAYYNILGYTLFSSQSELNHYLASQVKSHAASCNFITRGFTPDIRTGVKCGKKTVSYRVLATERTGYSTYTVTFEY